MTTPSDVWIGLLELEGPRTSPILEGSTGAFVNYIAVAPDESDFANEARGAVTDLGLTLLRIHWSERLAERRVRFEVEEYLLRMAQEVERTGSGAFGSFHVWDDDDDAGGDAGEPTK